MPPTSKKLREPIGLGLSVIACMCLSVTLCIRSSTVRAGRGSSIESMSAWHASSPEFDPHVRHIPTWRLGHENISMAILPFPLIQEEQLSVTGEKNVH